MNKTRVLLLLSFLLPSCASIVSGTTQEIGVSTTPEKASCEFFRDGEKFAEIDKTPSKVLVQKTKYDITIECEKEGYQKSSFINESGSEGSTFGNIILGGGIGWAVDSARGADNKYQDNVHINLVKE